MRIPQINPTKFEAIGIALCLLFLVVVFAHQVDVKFNPIKHGNIELMNHNIQFLCFDEALVINEYKGFTYTEEDRAELERVVSFTCPVKANQRPWIQRMVGMASHFHFVSLDENKAWQLVAYGLQDPGVFSLHPFKHAIEVDGISRNGIPAHIATCDLDFNVIEN
jgi:hypothetical protein